MPHGAQAASETEAPGALSTSHETDDADAAALALERAAQGDEEAFLALYDRYADLLFGIAVRITQAAAEAEEVLQDAMTRAWLEATTFERRRGSAVAWLITLTRNRAIDVVRARSTRSEYEAAAYETSAGHEGIATPERETDEAQRARAVHVAMRHLNRDQRTTLDLAFFGGLTHSEIAEKLGQPLGTVKSRIGQSLRILRDALATLESSDEPSE